MPLIAAYIKPDGGRQIETQENAAPATSVARLIGPGLLVAAAGIGAGDIVSATMAASGHGLRLLWVVALAAFLKCFLNEGIARWQLATDTTAIEGWSADWTIRALRIADCGLRIASPEISESAIRNPQSTINPQSAIRDPQFRAPT